MDVTEEDTNIGIESYGDSCIDINLKNTKDTNKFYKASFF